MVLLGQATGFLDRPLDNIVSILEFYLKGTRTRSRQARVVEDNGGLWRFVFDDGFASDAYRTEEAARATLAKFLNEGR